MAQPGGVESGVWPRCRIGFQDRMCDGSPDLLGILFPKSWRSPVDESSNSGEPSDTGASDQYSPAHIP